MTRAKDLIEQLVKENLFDTGPETYYEVLKNLRGSLTNADWRLRSVSKLLANYDRGDETTAIDVANIAKALADRIGRILDKAS